MSCWIMELSAERREHGEIITYKLTKQNLAIITKYGVLCALCGMGAEQRLCHTGRIMTMEMK